LFDIKGFGIGESSDYISFRAEQGQLKPFDRRAVKVDKAYCKAAKDLDSKYHHTPDDEVGPVKSALLSLGPVADKYEGTVLGLGIGCFGELFAGFNDVFTFIARNRAVSCVGRYDEKSPIEALGMFRAKIRRVWGHAAVFAWSDLALDRSRKLVGMQSTAARATRAGGDEAHQHERRGHEIHTSTIGAGTRHTSTGVTGMRHPSVTGTRHIRSAGKGRTSTRGAVTRYTSTNGAGSRHEHSSRGHKATEHERRGHETPEH